LLAQLGAMGQVSRLAAQLQGHRVLLLVEIEVARHIPMQQRPVVTISVYSQVWRVIWRWKTRQWRSVQSIMGATDKVRGGRDVFIN
jgi:hypothetical protein